MNITLRRSAPKVLDSASRASTLASEGNPEAESFPESVKLNFRDLSWAGTDAMAPSFRLHLGAIPEQI